MLAARAASLACLVLLLNLALLKPHQRACDGRRCSEPLRGSQDAGAMPRQLLLTGAAAGADPGRLPLPAADLPPRPPAVHPNQTADQLLQALAQGTVPGRRRPGVVCLVGSSPLLGTPPSSLLIGAPAYRAHAMLLCGRLLACFVPCQGRQLPLRAAHRPTLTA
jgi:hypothetical protein